MLCSQLEYKYCSNLPAEERHEGFDPVIMTVICLCRLQRVQFYLGPENSGAPMHYHNDAINALAHVRTIPDSLYGIFSRSSFFIAS